LLIAFANRAEFQTDIPARDWFWVMLRNLGLDEYRRVEPQDVPVITDILYRFVWRLYDENGYGGLWPLQVPTEDQRNVEIFYQFCAYVAENQLI
jgi:DNA-directed RNA polymerase specialized sigma24 family protein